METKRRPVPVVKEFQVKSPPASADLLEPLLPRPIYTDMQEARPSQPYQLGAEVYLSGLSQQCQTQFSAGLISNAYGYYPIHQDVEFPANTGISCQKPAAEQQRIGNLLSQSNNQAQKQIINRSTCLDDGTCSFSQLQAAFGWRTNVPNQSARVQGQNNCDPLGQWNNLSFGDLLAEMPTTSVMPQDNKGPTSSILISDLNCPPQDETLASSAPMISENQEIAFATTRHSNTTCTQDMQSGAFPCQYWNTYDLNLSLSTENILTNGGRQVLQPTAGGPCQRFEAPRVADGKSLCTDSSSNQQSEKAEGQLTASRVDELEKLAAESLSSMVESCNPDKGVNNTDLNKTPEQKRRRKKHRPKVVSEDKPERTAKPKVPQPTNSLRTPKPKRKYTRRNKIHPPSTPLTAATPPEEAAGPKELVRAVKSSRRGLNFDLDGQVKISDSSTNSTSATGIKSIPAVHLTQEDKLTREMAQVRSAYNLSCKVNQVLKDHITMSDIGKVSRASQEEAKANAVYESEVNGNYQPAATSSMKGKGMGTMLSKDSLETLGPNFSASASSNNGEEKMGSKRAYSYILDDMHMTNKNMNSTHGAYWQSSPMYVQDSLQFPETHKKKRTEKLQKPITSSINFTSTISEASRQKNSPQDHRRKNHTVIKHHQNCTPQLITCAAPYHQANAFGAADNSLDAMMTWEDLEKTKKKRSKVPTRVRDLASLKGFAAGRSLPANPTKPKRKYTRRKKVELPNSTPACMEALAAYSSVTHTTKKRTRKRNPSISLDQSNIHATDMQRSLVLYEDLKSVRNYSGPYLALPWKDPFSVDAVTEALKRLDICRERDETGTQEHNSLVIYSTNDKAQNALVLYKKDDTMVPFKGSHDHIRKRQPRAKVHLDDETNRVWRLLLDNINNEGINGTDEEKAKWWENERSVFHGRVDSFIARMRLVQGDRRFSPWKGSVVDSCVGVFLTQNVSDHLSSSAFMSMAAQFPLKPEGEIKIDSEGNSILIEEPVDHDSSVTWTERTSDTISRTFHDTDHGEEKEVVNSKELLGGASPNHHSCSTPYLTGCHQDTHNESITTQETQTESTSGDAKGVDYVPSFQYPVVSSQNFAESPTAPTAGRVSSCSDSNSEQEDPTTSYSNLFDSTPSFVQLLKMAESPIPHEGFLHDAPSYLTHKQVKTDRKQHHKQVFAQNADCIQILDEESRSSDNLSRKDQNHSVEQSELTRDSITKFRLYNRNPYTIQKPFFPAQNTCSCYVFEKEKMIIESELQSTQQDHPDLPTSSKSGCVTNNINLSVEKVDSKHTFVKPSSDKSSASAETPSILNENKTKQKKGRSRKDTKTAVDWDSLRKQAQAAHGIRGRTDNTMDSLDWEAVRRADVSEIAETIKYRGMNNMLAERIKDFLDRLVREHDSIDLEWLRDVPPDKAKEYLLSIKGLGLKSVECVRLLTLHHLAFPVDTNVGRIAVRLGWVPLQPLPESLQLHLLEMYPVLESIQKYLWPRLCKLDQRTLYELHYHMITFGKVFCTKRQPNCNACPLRGECRHFASAFASARFGLPGPEEKSIMTATQSAEALHDPQVTINPLSLLEAKEHEQSEAEPKVRNCDPIIEVPASPEAEQVYISEHDIEDAFFEDPEDIPTIRLNMEQFTQTLQNYMQGNMELQEAEMSKALVALTPEAATIQIPRLKNVSRLRTEHHVYELPDDHPLLQGLDKREPDDPCSYLLAIWTPGETANSIQPPEKRCTSEGLGELCEDVTCFCCNSQREASSQIVRGTLLIPCRTAMRGSFPLNGTYFQVNEVFADHDSSITPLSIPRGLIWDLPRKTVYFGTSVPSIFRGLSTEGIQHCFWKGYVCVRGFDQKTRGPRPLMARLHFPASRRNGTKGKGREEYE